MAPQALLSQRNTGERAAAAVCCARGAPAAPEQEDTWGGSFMISLCFPECRIGLGALGHGKMRVCSFHLPQPSYFSVFKTEPRSYGVSASNTAVPGLIPSCLSPSLAGS